jgi:hypothetical protein
MILSVSKSPLTPLFQRGGFIAFSFAKEGIDFFPFSKGESYFSLFSKRGGLIACPSAKAGTHCLP